ncbi:TetR family transcriptional regulator [Nonomuraea phyllanthi]|uniref:TetR family transcriptional regulator n=1 Tax=Nonomuraea phyllanthi TaxID=2219224 RepID=A0A5C4VK02_9ACTN|nr:TetR/AcrR family transcriptional regulator [Nonomuraea phyllanthi]KAB8189064.1 TetR family transcriptional regulator [Nonomuraea phyllanthi]QFY09735.1 TetR family transcriptional regulator [Nonomuraea phyllanthi]
MATRTRQSQRRRQVLTRERIVETAVELLDTVGKDALTVRALTGRLATGSGAIYWHIGNMDELLEAATDAVVADALATRPTRPAGAGSPQDEIRAVALGLFDAVTEHPWLAAQLAAQLTRNPWGPVTLRIFENIGRPVRTLGVPQGVWFTTTSTLVHYILGATAQTSQSTGVPSSEAERAEFLGTASRAWQDLDPDDYPFMRAIADQMREHDDREQFLTGIDLILTGITTLHPPEPARRSGEGGL